MKKPFMHAFGAASYIVVLVAIMSNISSILELREDNIAMPMTMLGVLVLSAAVMGYLFLSEPLKLFLENRKQEAVTFFIKTVGVFACFVVIFAILVFLL